MDIQSYIERIEDGNVNNIDEVIVELTPHAEKKDREAAYLLGRAYMVKSGNRYQKVKNIAYELQNRRYEVGDKLTFVPKKSFSWHAPTMDPSHAKEAYKFFLMSAKAGYVPAYNELAYMYLTGLGTKKNLEEACHYYKKYVGEINDSLPKINYAEAFAQLSLLCEDGVGTQKNIPLAFKYAVLARDNGVNCGDFLVKSLEQNYPIGENGEIDITKRGRTYLTSLGLVVGIVFSLIGLVLPSIWQTADELLGNTPFYIGMSINLIAYLAAFFWQKWGIWLLIVKIVTWPYMFVSTLKCWEYIFSGLPLLQAKEQLCLAFVADILLLLVLFIAYQQREDGSALTWCWLLGIKDDGRSLFNRLTDPIMAYGEGDAYRVHSLFSKSYRIICYIITAVVALYGLFIVYLYITSGINWGLLIDWNPFHWPKLITILFILGYVAEISAKIWMTYEEGSIIDGVYKPNDDILSVLFGQIVYPLVFFLFLGPAILAIVTFYVIIFALTIFGVFFPFVILVLFLLLPIPFYLGARCLLPRRWRTILLSLWTIFFISFESLALIPIWSNVNVSTSNAFTKVSIKETPQYIKEVIITVETANLRTGPGNKYPYAVKYVGNGGKEKWQLHNGDRLYVIDIIGDWYKAIPVGEDSVVYVSTKICSDY